MILEVFISNFDLYLCEPNYGSDQVSAVLHQSLISDSLSLGGKGGKEVVEDLLSFYVMQSVALFVLNFRIVILSLD